MSPSKQTPDRMGGTWPNFKKSDRSWPGSTRSRTGISAEVVFAPGPAAAWRAYRRAAGADITKAWRVTAWSRCPARESGGGHARVPGGALRLAAHRRPRRRATALLHLLLGELRRRGHDPGDHLVRPGQLLRRQSEGHLSLAGPSGGGSSGGGSSGGAWRA